MATTFEETTIKQRPLAIAMQAALASGALLVTTPIWSAETTRVSITNNGTAGYGGSYQPSISADGRFVAFSSVESNLITGDTNGKFDIFVRDRMTDTTTRVSVSSAGTQANNDSRYASISADGRYVAFVSDASNLVAGDTNNLADVFVRDRATNQTTRVSVSSNGVQSNGYSSYNIKPAISANGRFVAFFSDATNLVPNDTNAARDIFVRDRLTNQTTRVSVNNAGTQGNYPSDFPAISANGRYVSFLSIADNLVANDTNAVHDVFVRDRTTNQTTRVSISSAGVQGNNSSLFNSISADGRFITFNSFASNLVTNDTNATADYFVRDRVTGQTSRVSVSTAGVQGNYDTSRPNSPPAISADGRFVAFRSSASNLVFGDTNNVEDIFVRDRIANQTTRISVSTTGAQGNYNSISPAVSMDGRFIVFASDAINLVPNDLNSSFDIFLRDRLLNPAVTANLGVTQSVSANPVVKGSSFSFTATVKNLGPGNAANVALTNIPPLNNRITETPALTPSQGSCSLGTISICRLGTLNVGQQATVQMTFTALNPGIVSNRVSVNASPKDPIQLNNAVATNTTISP